MDMKQQFKDWLGEKRYANTTVIDYSREINDISKHYSENTDENIDIYALTDLDKINEIMHEYRSGNLKLDGKSSTRKTSRSRYKSAILRYCEFFTDYSDTQELGSGKLPPLSTTLACEKCLQNILCELMPKLFPSYKIYGREYSIKDKRIDILLEHDDTGDLLVVELKKGTAKYKVFGQISMYLGLLQEEFPDKSITGVIVAGKIDRGLKSAVSTVNTVSLKTYNIKIELKDA